MQSEQPINMNLSEWYISQTKYITQLLFCAFENILTEKLFVNLL